MNDATRANVFRKPEGASTPEGWSDLREAVKGVREDLVATNLDRHGHPGKWAVRYPNGDRPANEADCTFMACARNTVLSLMDKIESLYKESGERKAEFLKYQVQAAEAIRSSKDVIEKLKADHTKYVEELVITHGGHTAALQSQIDGLLAEVTILRKEVAENSQLLMNAPEALTPVERPPVPAAEPKAIVKSPKRKTTAKAIAAITDPTPVPVTAESSHTDEN